jgi:peptide/nickel transport system ATP-binding protein
VTLEADPTGDDAAERSPGVVDDAPTLSQAEADAEAARRAAAEAAASREHRTLLTIKNLKTYYPIRAGILRRVVGHVRAVDDVSFEIKRGEVFGLVGESGCGKTTLGRTVLRLEQPTAGSAEFDGVDLLKLHGSSLKKMRRRMQVIFQDPVGSLNPQMPVSDLIGEGLLAQATPENGWHDRKIRDKRVGDYLEEVGLRREYSRRYPHEFSGGQRQRIGIARALALSPEFIFADEPVSALDVSIQSQVLNLLLDLRERFALTFLFVAHNLSVVQYISDRVGVMYLGKLVEVGDVEDLYANPRHPYTVALLSAIPDPNPRVRKRLIVLKGDVPSPAAPPSGCRFHTRCWLFEQLGKPERCITEDPELRSLEPASHRAACHFAERVGEPAVRQAEAAQDVIETAEPVEVPATTDGATAA